MKNLENFNSFIFEKIKLKMTDNTYDIGKELADNKSYPEILDYLNNNFVGKTIQLKSDGLSDAIIINVKKFETLTPNTFTVYSDKIYVDETKYKTIILSREDIITELEIIDVEDIKTDDHLAVDPYGEEDWEDNEYVTINESLINTDNLILEKVKTFRKTHNRYDIERELADNKSYLEILDYLNDNFIGKTIELKSSNAAYSTAVIKNVIKFELKITDSINVCSNEIYLGGYKKPYGDINVDKRDTVTELKYFDEDEIRHNKYREDDPFGEEDWDDDEYVNINEALKKKIYKIKRLEIDPYDEEDWGWNYNNEIDDSKFVGRNLIYKRKRFDNIDYHSFKLKTHDQASSGIYLDYLIKHDKVMILTSREVDRIKRNKIEISTSKSKYNDYGNYERFPYSSLKDDSYFLDQEYFDKYLNKDYISENKKFESKEWKINCNNINDIYKKIQYGKWYKVTKDVRKSGIKKQLIFFNKEYIYFDKVSRIVRIERIVDDWGRYNLIFNYEYIDGEIIKHRKSKGIDFYDSDNVVIEFLDDAQLNKKWEEVNNKNRMNHIDIDPYDEENWDES